MSSVDWETLFIPDSWMFAYRITHTFLVPIAIGAVFWLFKHRWPFPLLIGWSSHIVLDMFTHTGVYSNRPLFPLSDFTIHGVNWAEPYIFFPNRIALGVIYGIMWWRWYVKKKNLPS